MEFYTYRYYAYSVPEVCGEYVLRKETVQWAASNASAVNSVTVYNPVEMEIVYAKVLTVQNPAFVLPAHGTRVSDPYRLTLKPSVIPISESNYDAFKIWLRNCFEDRVRGIPTACCDEPPVPAPPSIVPITWNEYNEP